MTFLELQEAYLDFFTESATKSNVVDREMKRYLNESMQYYARMIRRRYSAFFVNEQNFSEVSDQRDYSLPDRFVECKWLRRISGGGATEDDWVLMEPVRGTEYELDRFRFRYRGGHGMPIAYEIRGTSKLSLYPTPTADRTAALKMRFSYSPANMVADADEPFQRVAGPAVSGNDLFEEFHDLIWRRAVFFGSLKEEAGVWIGALKRELLDDERELMKSLRKINTHKPRTVHRPPLTEDLAYGPWRVP